MWLRRSVNVSLQREKSKYMLGFARGCSILREYGLLLSELHQIEESVEASVVHGLKQKNLKTS